MSVSTRSRLLLNRFRLNRVWFSFRCSADQSRQYLQSPFWQQIKCKHITRMICFGSPAGISELCSFNKNNKSTVTLNLCQLSDFCWCFREGLFLFWRAQVIPVSHLCSSTHYSPAAAVTHLPLGHSWAQLQLPLRAHQQILSVSQIYSRILNIL